MGYRDETETLRARLAEAERELEDARETIGRLTGLTSAPETERREERSALTGQAKRVQLERELDLRVSEEGLEAIAALIRKRMPNATVAQVGRTLSAPGFSLTQKDGMTQIAMDADYRGAAGGLVALSTLGGFFGTMGSLAVFHDFISRLPEAELLPHVLWMLPLLTALLFVALRGRVGGRVRDRATELRGTFEAVVELAKRHRVREEPRVRVETTVEEEEEVEVARFDEREASVD